MHGPDLSVERVARFTAFRVLAILLVPVFALAAPSNPEPTASTWPQAYTVERNKAAKVLTLRTPCYAVDHDLKRGGAISRIRLTHGRSTNLLVQPVEARLTDEHGNILSDLTDPDPRVDIREDGPNRIVFISSRLRDSNGKRSPVRLNTIYEYRWGYIKVRREFSLGKEGLGAQEICPVALTVAPSLSSYGYRDGLTEEEGASPFSFGSCRWGRLEPGATNVIKEPFIPRYVMFVDPGVEGLEWFVSSELSQWDLQPAGKRGQGRAVLQSSTAPGGVVFSASPLHTARSALLISGRLTFDFYLGMPLLEGRAIRPWFHESFNRNRGEWVTPSQFKKWTENGIQTVHCHNDGDYYDDGLFWRDGSYPPYPDMENYDKVIADCHGAGIRVATYFSNKELHSSTPQFKEHSLRWGRMNRKGDLQRNFYKPGSEFGVQMCLRSGWLNDLKGSIERVLTNHKLDGVYYDWNVGLLCSNPAHEKVETGRPAAHWDIDELLDLMEWTRRRVGPHGLVIIHNTTTPMFATENFANHIVANEWGYGKWSGSGPTLQELPLEWSLVGARSRGVISYGQLSAESSRRLHRLFALEALLSGVTPWPASPETFELFPVLKPIEPLETCRFADWRNQAVKLEGERCASAIYSRPEESWVLLGNLKDKPQEIRCMLRPGMLPHPLKSVQAATLYPGGSGSPVALQADELTGSGVMVTIPGDTALLIRCAGGSEVKKGERQKADSRRKKE